ncbi:uncharacterized protein OCT59_005105 [Rhizophagus irregularis]|uniref:Uncharacterized protein n=2 Tax=Rhizophagus irregularis TaxID=588596 RepID=A0A916E002_9GLOM|nr:hypothetical protein OCT59_005105 [Rhizophagus irregularis]CAB4484661.1 unnamed protein product [Rhizophagus irregularis]CAB5311682.1 unnamed protein product [Rhizophagus irregularis]CAG8570035.1 16944_t:CDS:1 [Rhizophagus irregularis]
MAQFIMNHNYIIILFLTLFLTHVKKTFGCHPAGEFFSSGAEVQNATFSSSQISITTFAPNSFKNDGMYTDALGHFTFDYTDFAGGIYYSGHVRILHDPKFVNDHKCTDTGPNAVNPYTSTWNYDPKLTPP